MLDHPPHIAPDHSNSAPDPAEDSEPKPKPPRATTSLRAILVGIVAVVLTVVLVTYAELVISTIRIGYLQLPPVSLAILLLLIGIVRGTNALLKQRLKFSQIEIITVYVMSLVAAMISSHGMSQKLLPLLVVLNYFGTSANDWRHVYSSHMSRWTVPYIPQGPDQQLVSKWYYEGLPRGSAIPWLDWLTPLLTWSLLFALVFFAFLCLTAILRKQWVDNERLAFPLAQLPLEIIGSDEQGRSFFARPLVWLGAAIPFVVYGVDWAHQVVPSLPYIPIFIDINKLLLSAPPWNQIGYSPVIFSFAAIGFFYLLPTDILFSLWFFFALDRFEQFVGIQHNWNMPPMPSSWLPMFQGYQTIGAYIALAGYFAFVARAHLKRIVQSAFSKTQSDESAHELLPYRTAFWGLVGSIVGSCLIMRLMGMSLWLCVLEMVCVVFILGLVMARSTAEAGMLMTETTFQPSDIYKIVGNMHSLGTANLTVLGFMDHLFAHDQRSLLLTGMLDSTFMADHVKLQRRSLAKVIVIGIGAAALVALPLQLLIAYNHGALKLDYWMMNGSPHVPFNVDGAYLAPGGAATGPVQMPIFCAVGIVVTLLLTFMRTKFFWWPLHPLGYALAGSQSTLEFWFPCLVAWLFKSLTLRYGGRSFYQTMRPFFLGLILGEFVMAVLSALGQVLFNVPAPPFPWQ